MFVCYMYVVYGCVYMCISVCHCVSTFGMVDASLYIQVYFAQVQKNTHIVDHYFPVYMLQLTQCDVIV